MQISFTPIGFIESPFREKFGIPRQPGLIPESRAKLKLSARPGLADSIRELTEFSHIWVIFIFHEVPEGEFKPTIRPPRLGGSKRIGVFASRSPHRPNPIGISAVALESIETQGDGSAILHLSGCDFLDGTPVLDIKPYIPYADSLPQAKPGWASGEPEEKIEVEFSPEAREACARASRKYPEFETLVIRVLGQDPRPAFQTDENEIQHYAMRLWEFDVHWEVRGGKFVITKIL